MLKTPEALCAALKDAKASPKKLRLDPSTNLEEWSRGLLILSFMSLFVFGPYFYSEGLAGGISSLIPCLGLLVIAVILPLNQFWEVDLPGGRVRSVTHWLGMEAASSDEFALNDILGVAVSNHRHTQKRRGWWEYGVCVLTKDGSMHRLFPNLSKNLPDVVQCAEALADLVQAPLLDYVPKAKLVVNTSLGVPHWNYEGQVNSQTLEVSVSSNSADHGENR